MASSAHAAAADEVDPSPRSRPTRGVKRPLSYADEQEQDSAEEGELDHTPPPQRVASAAHLVADSDEEWVGDEDELADSSSPASAAATPSSKRARQTPPQDTTPPQNGAKMSAFASSSSSSKTPASSSSSKPKAPAACKGKGTGKRELKAAAKAAELQAETIEGRLKVLNSAKLWREVLVPLFPKYPGLKEDILAGVAAQKVDLSHYKPELDLLEASYEKLNPRYASDNHYTYGRLRPGLMALRTRMLAMVEQLQSSNQHTAVLEFVLTQGLPRAERIPTFAEERDNQLRRILIAKLDAAAEKAAKALLKSGLADSARQARLDTILASWRAELPRTAAALGGPPLVKKPKTPNRRAEIERQGARAFLSLLGDDYC